MTFRQTIHKFSTEDERHMKNLKRNQPQVVDIAGLVYDNR
jgi:hypothetical protein